MYHGDKKRTKSTSGALASGFMRTDLWREGAWLDLWSVVHFLSGSSIGLGLSFLHFGAAASVVLVLLSLISYEMWEALVHIQETPANRFMDVLVGMVSFLLTFFFLVPRLSLPTLVRTFGLIFTINILLSIFGWRASQKAALFEKHLRARYATQHTQFLEQKAHLRKTFRRKKARSRESFAQEKREESSRANVD